MRIAAIASMKKGLEHFIYRELCLLSAQGVSIRLFPTKYGKGLYTARDERDLQRWNLFAVLLWQPYFLVHSPFRYMSLLWEAVAVGAVIDFALAWYFSRTMADIDLIYATFGDRKFFVGYFCKRILHKPLAVTIHAYELYDNPNPRLFERALAVCDQVIVPTEYNREYLATHYQVAPTRVEVVRYSVDIEDYRPNKKFVILIVGFFVERKGHEVLFKALTHVNQEDIEVWVVGGEGAEAPVDVRALATQLGIDRHVAFFGPLSGNALKAVYRACDVFCLPCRTEKSGVAEGFPNVLIEAMAFGKPVITTRHVEIPRIIKDIVVDENDVEGLAQAIRQAYQSASLRERLGKTNRQIAEEVFSPRNVARTAQILSRLANPHQSQTAAYHETLPAVTTVQEQKMSTN
ncbi:MAG: glycosyltransferase family 4 protein [Deltaproteobacteria bacterium]|nr:glycosyltransferase family 4 protein [Deltaproteobacteria bacterium]